LRREGGAPQQLQRRGAAGALCWQEDVPPGKAHPHHVASYHAASHRSLDAVRYNGMAEEHVFPGNLPEREATKICSEQVKRSAPESHDDSSMEPPDLPHNTVNLKRRIFSISSVIPFVVRVQRSDSAARQKARTLTFYRFSLRIVCQL